MTVQVIEKAESRESTVGDSPAVELLFIVTGTDDDLAAKTELALQSPVIYDGLTRANMEIQWLGPEVWDGTVRYTKKDKERPQTGEARTSFDTGGGTQHITQSIETVKSYALAGENAPDFKSAIGVTDDSVEGVDIALPVYNFTETHYLPIDFVSDSYRQLLFHKTGMYNNDSFKGFSAGEVLFMGASGSQRGVEDWEITFRFAASQNRSDIKIGDIGPIAKRGWEYLWVRYADDVDKDKKNYVKKPIAVYVEKVYYGTSFKSLGIGG